jgi:hypothetical protein
MENKLRSTDTLAEKIVIQYFFGADSVARRDTTGINNQAKIGALTQSLTCYGGGRYLQFSMRPN